MLIKMSKALDIELASDLHNNMYIMNNNLALCSQKPNCSGTGLSNVSKRYWRPSTVEAEFRRVIDPEYNKGLAYSLEERQRLSVMGMLPYAERTVEQQVIATAHNFHSSKTNMEKYNYMRNLRTRIERLYYRFINEHIEEVMPIIYTPTVGQICQEFSMFFHNAMGVYITKFDKGHMVDVLRNWPARDVRAICVTDGGRILGLGDLGANGMGISVGKLDLYTALAKIPPQYLLPAVLDVGTDNKQLLADPMYIGVREKRVKGEEYEDLVQEFMDAVVKCYGYETLIHFEDFATPNAFKFIRKYQNSYCYFNDDIQGTAATGLAGFLGVERVTKIPLEKHVILFVGAGSAALGICKLLTKELANRNVSEEDAAKNIYVTDNVGLITKDRENLIPDLKPFAKDRKTIKSLEEIVEVIKPSILLGATGMGGIFTEKVLRTMGKNHKRPGIFACSNPTIKAECTAEQAYNFTEGRALYCSGSPFPPVVINGKRIVPGQANNAFAFPGVALGVMCAKPNTITDEVFLITARTISEFVLDDDPNTESLYPRVKDAQKVSFRIAVNVVQYLLDNNMANIFPKPDDICKFITSHQYYTDYDTALSPTWEYPERKSMDFGKNPIKEARKAKKSGQANPKKN